MAKVTKRDLAIIAGLAGAADFLAEGRFSAPLARALKKTAVAVGKRALFTAPTAARFTGATALRAAGTVASIGKTIAMRHPVLTGGAVVYYTYQNRDELGSLVEQGYEVVQDIADVSRAKFDEGIRPITGLGFPKMPKRKKTKFNRMVSAGMKKLKGSTSYGKKGVINAPKKAFKAVTQAASAVTKKKKLPKSGIKRILMSFMRKIR
jgi:hypothetical protein